MAANTNRYIREVLHSAEAPSPIPVCYFYTSPLAIDDPLSPLPPPATAASSARRHLPRPFSEYDNEAINKTWLELRKKILRHNEELGEKGPPAGVPSAANDVGSARMRRQEGLPVPGNELPTASQSRDIPSTRSSSRAYSRSADTPPDGRQSSSAGLRGAALPASLRALDPSDSSPVSGPAITGTPFIRAPSRRNVKDARKSASASASGSVEERRRPVPHDLDSYKWDDDMEPTLSGYKVKDPVQAPPQPATGPSVKVPVGVSRLHHVAMDANSIRMEPTYWHPVNDVAAVVRGTWFYKETMMPVETDVANMLELGYLGLQPWTQTWADELNSATEVGAVGEMKILHKLWPDKPKKPESRPVSSAQMHAGLVQSTLPETEGDPEQELREIVENACDLIDVSTGHDGPDNKASGNAENGQDGRKTLYRTAAVIYANAKEAYLLRPSLQPSAYYGRRPLANYIRKNRNIGICVTRGFDREAWNKLHPTKDTPTAMKAREGVSSSQTGASLRSRQKADPELSHSERPQVTDLVLVIHGIGQKLSERIETFHFTHAINAFRREVNVELGTDDVKRHLRKDAGGIMVLPVNWRQRVTLEEGDSGDTKADDLGANQYTLKDITPDSLPAVRGIVSDVMLDIPYYLSPDHNAKMVSACITEANRIYRLWCQNNPGFAQWGRVHLVAHSLGSVMAIDILSQQPSHVPHQLTDPSYPEEDLPRDHFIFNTKSLFVCGSPAGFFLLLKKAALLPRRDNGKPGAESYITPGVAGEQGTYGCIAVDNIYNIVNPYDPVAYRLNPTVDVSYAEMLKPAIIPSANASWFTLSNPFRKAVDPADALHGRPSTNRLPSNVELETHNFTREEIAEERAYLLNDNGQIDYFLKYGGGALEIQYLTMLGAHSSYWLSRDFVRMIVVEVGRAFGKEGTVLAMRAQKRKMSAA